MCITNGQRSHVNGSRSVRQGDFRADDELGALLSMLLWCNTLLVVYIRLNSRKRWAPHSLHRPERILALVGKERVGGICPHWLPQSRQRSCGPMSETDLTTG